MANTANKAATSDLRKQLLRDGTVKQSVLPSEIRHADKAESQAAAIAARRADLRMVATTTYKRHS